MTRFILILTLFGAGFCNLQHAFAQPVPGDSENIPFLVTFGSTAPTDWGDDDHLQVFFFSLPAKKAQPFYLRIFDPEIGGQHDENRGGFNTKTRFSVFGGKGAFSHPDAKNVQPTGNFKSGTMIFNKVFGQDNRYDDQWYTIGPINPREGEPIKDSEGERYMFKIVCEGIGGDDGNLYRYFFSTQSDRNVNVEGGQTFTYEYTFRLKRGMTHLYPFVDNNVLKMRQHNFDFDGDGYIRLVSMGRKSSKLGFSANGEWKTSTHVIQEDEKNSCIDIQIVSMVQKKNNNVVFYITNQYNENLPFMNIPIGLNFENKIKVVPGRHFQ